MPEKKKCKQCGHPRSSHSIQGCLHNGQCPYNCQVKYMDTSQFE